MKKLTAFILSIFLICIVGFSVFRFYDASLRGDAYVAYITGKKALERLNTDEQERAKLFKRNLDIYFASANHLSVLDSENIVMADSICVKIMHDNKSLIKYNHSNIMNAMASYKALIASVLINSKPKHKVRERFLSGIDFHWEVPERAADSLKYLMAEVKTRQIENRVGKYLLALVGDMYYKYDTMCAIAMSDSPVVKAGEIYKAHICLGQYDSHTSVNVEVDGGGILTMKNGTAIYETEVRGIGRHSLKGNVIVMTPDGSEKKYPFQTFYYVIHE